MSREQHDVNCDHRLFGPFTYGATGHGWFKKVAIFELTTSDLIGRSLSMDSVSAGPSDQ